MGSPPQASPEALSYLQPDAAGDGEGVAVLVVQLDVVDQHLVHTHGVTGRQGVQLGLQRARWSPRGQEGTL